MVNKYTIVINNRSGIYQNYTLFTEKPEVTGISNSSIWTNVYQASDVIFDSADAQFEMLENYQAIVGKWKGGPKEGARVGIGQTKKVNLGSLSDDGSLNPGTTLNMSAFIIDFANSGPNIIINHTPTGELVIAK